VPLLLLGPPFFLIILFWVHHVVNQDDRHLLAHAMASDFSVPQQPSAFLCLQDVSDRVDKESFDSAILAAIERNKTEVVRSNWYDLLDAPVIF
jgi:hypothetical protein